MAFTGDSIFWVELEKIVPNPFQPRREFDEAKLKELADSIRMYGILQPLTVTRKEIQRDDGAFYSEYELIAGERRMRASKLAGLTQVPVIIRDGEQTEQEKLELAIIENLQREDLNAVDRALAFRQLADVFGLSHAKVAQKVGRSREYVSNTLRLLQLPEYMLSSLRLGDITEGHGRALLMLNDRPEEQDTLYREILLKKLSVREVERITRKVASDKVRSKKWKNTDPELIEIERKFTETLGTRVQISKTDFGGKLTIDYFAPEDLEKILALVKQEKPSVVSDEPAQLSDSDTSETEVERDAIEAVAETLEEVAEETSDVVETLANSTPLAAIKENVMETPEEPAPAPETVAPHESEVATESTEPVLEQPEPVQSMEAPESPITEETFVNEEEVKEKDDDSDLYSLKNFGI